MESPFPRLSATTTATAVLSLYNRVVEVEIAAPIASGRRSSMVAAIFAPLENPTAVSCRGAPMSPNRGMTRVTRPYRYINVPSNRAFATGMRLCPTVNAQL